MNPKIRELIQRHERIQNLYQIGPVQRAEVEAFVEEIVQECITVIEAAKPGVDQLPPEVALTMAANNVRAYFGL